MVLLHKYHAPLVICTHFVLISYSFLIYMPTYQPYPIATNQVDVA